MNNEVKMYKSVEIIPGAYSRRPGGLKNHGSHE
jgi:hypothetical protein